MGRADKDDVIEQVRVGLLRMMEHNRGLTRAVVAERVGCKDRTLEHFIQRDRPSLALALRIARVFPDVGDIPGLPPRCRYCGHFTETTG